MRVAPALVQPKCWCCRLLANWVVRDSVDVASGKTPGLVDALMTGIDYDRAVSDTMLGVELYVSNWL